MSLDMATLRHRHHFSA